MKIVVISTTELTNEFEKQGVKATRTTVSRACVRAGVGVYSKALDGAGNVRLDADGKPALKCVGVLPEDVATVKAEIRSKLGNPTFGTPNNPQTLRRLERERRLEEAEAKRQARAAARKKAAKKKSR